MPDPMSIVGGLGPSVTAPLVNPFVRPQAVADTTGAKPAQPQSEKTEATTSNDQVNNDLLNRLDGLIKTEEQGKNFPQEQQPTLEEAAETLAQFLEKLPSDMQVKFDKETDRILFKLINPVTREVVRQYPPDEFLNLVRHLREMDKNSTNRGIFLDDRH